MGSPSCRDGLPLSRSLKKYICIFAHILIYFKCSLLPPPPWRDASWRDGEPALPSFSEMVGAIPPSLMGWGGRHPPLLAGTSGDPRHLWRPPEASTEIQRAQRPPKPQKPPKPPKPSKTQK